MTGERQGENIILHCMCGNWHWGLNLMETGHPSSWQVTQKTLDDPPGARSERMPRTPLLSLLASQIGWPVLQAPNYNFYLLSPKLTWMKVQQQRSKCLLDPSVSNSGPHTWDITPSGATNPYMTPPKLLLLKIQYLCGIDYLLQIKLRVRTVTSKAGTFLTWGHGSPELVSYSLTSIAYISFFICKNEPQRDDLRMYSDNVL